MQVNQGIESVKRSMKHRSNTEYLQSNIALQLPYLEIDGNFNVVFCVGHGRVTDSPKFMISLQIQRVNAESEYIHCI
jgi:hypothetical protein